MPTEPATDTATLQERLAPYRESHGAGTYGFAASESPGEDARIWPQGINYNSIITRRWGVPGRDRYQIWHMSSGSHYRGYVAVHGRGRHSSEFWIVEVLEEADAQHNGRYRIIESYRAGQQWRRVYPLVLALCQALNNEKRD